MRRHADGDRSPGLLAAFARAASECRPAPSARQPMTQGRLPIEGLGSLETGPLHVQAYLEMCFRTITGVLVSQGLHPFLAADGLALQVDLPPDPGTGCTCRLQFGYDLARPALQVRAICELAPLPAPPSLLQELDRNWRRLLGDFETLTAGSGRRLVLDSVLMLQPRPGPEHLADSVQALITRIQAFWSFAIQSLGLPGSPL